MKIGNKLAVVGAGAAVAAAGVLLIPGSADAADKKPLRCMDQGSITLSASHSAKGDALATGNRTVPKSPCRDINVRVKSGRCASVRVRWVGTEPAEQSEPVGIATLPDDGRRDPVGIAALPDDRAPKRATTVAGATTKWRDVCTRWTVVAKGAAEGAAYRLEVMGAAGEARALRVRD